ncbi:MAG TPA: hypothetical protein VE619_11370 [Nitrososphaeraceae archaeon]|nr:hypothetical protein [Nitrososphaeraceae archaeon]
MTERQKQSKIITGTTITITTITITTNFTLNAAMNIHISCYANHAFGAAAPTILM